MIQKPILDTIKAFQTGSIEAFEVLVQRYQNLVTTIAYANTGDLQRSEDIAQQTFLTAWQKQEELSDPERFTSWLRAIAKNLSRNERRLKENVQQSKNVTYDEETLGGFAKDVEESPEEETSRREQSELLWATLERIPLEYREPLILFYREEKSVAEVAQQMELTNDNVKQRLKRARAMVKQEIESMVEELLFETRPKKQFSSAVLAAMPVVGAKLGTTAMKAGAAIGGKSVGGKAVTAVAASTLSLAGFLAMIGSVSAFFVGAGVAWMRTKKIAEQSTSTEEETIHWDSYWKSVFAAALFLSLLAFFSLVNSKVVGIVNLVWIIIPIFVQWAMVRPIKKELKIRKLQRIHGRPERLKGEPDLPLSPFTENASGATTGTIGGIVGAWGWLLLLLAIGAWFQLSLLIFLLIGIGIFAWQIAVARRIYPEEATFAQLQRISGEFIWKTCLIQAAFCASILLLFLNRETGELLLKAFQVQFSVEGFDTNFASPTASVVMLFFVCPFIISLGGLLRWSAVKRATYAEEEAELGWDDGTGKIVFVHPLDPKSKTEN